VFSLNSPNGSLVNLTTAWPVKYSTLLETPEVISQIKKKKKFFMAGLHNSESSKGQIDQHSLPLAARVYNLLIILL